MVGESVIEDDLDVVVELDLVELCVVELDDWSVSEDEEVDVDESEDEEDADVDVDETLMM